MDATTAKAILATAPDAVGGDLTSVLLGEEAASTNGLGPKDHSNGEPKDIATTDTKTGSIPSVVWDADAVNGDSNGVFTKAPMPLTNGHQAESKTAPHPKSDFDDIWHPGTKLKRRLKDTKDLIVCPGVYDGFSARIAISVGFDAMYMV